MLATADVIVGYTRYIELIAPLIAEKEIFQTGMTEEVERCREALEIARGGKRVAVVSSGDSGIYGMAGLILELYNAGSDKRDIEIEIVPGVPAFVSAAAVLGAPLMHDFASISLSDLLTPWETIKKRLDGAAGADFVIALYNPRSKRRVTQLPEAIEIITQYRKAKTPVGIVKDATRRGEQITITTLGELDKYFEKIDMSTILIVGNSSTFQAGEKIITPRGYRGI